MIKHMKEAWSSGSVRESCLITLDHAGFSLKVLVGVRDRSSVGVSAGEEVKIQ